PPLELFNHTTERPRRFDDVAPPIVREEIQGVAVATWRRRVESGALVTAVPFEGFEHRPVDGYFRDQRAYLGLFQNLSGHHLIGVLSENRRRNGERDLVAVHPQLGPYNLSRATVDQARAEHAGDEDDWRFAGAWRDGRRIDLRQIRAERRLAAARQRQGRCDYPQGCRPGEDDAPP